ISDADLGGNCERLDPPLERAKNLHALWDGGILNAMDASDKSLAASLETEIRVMRRSVRQRLSAGDQDDWAWEAHELAIRDIYGKLHIPIEPDEFPASCSEAPLDVTSFKALVDQS